MICSKCGSEDENIVTEKESIEILKILDLMYNEFKNMEKHLRKQYFQQQLS